MTTKEKPEYQLYYNGQDVIVATSPEDAEEQLRFYTDGVMGEGLEFTWEIYRKPVGMIWYQGPEFVPECIINHPRCWTKDTEEEDGEYTPLTFGVFLANDVWIELGPALIKECDCAYVCSKENDA
jgi:hypothetical protein